MHLSLKERLEMRLAGLPVPDLVPVKLIRRPKHEFRGNIPPKKFDEETALTIRSLYNPPETSYRTLAIEFDTCKATIEHIVRGKGAYRHLSQKSEVKSQKHFRLLTSDLTLKENDPSNFTTNW